jgi:hypothetical protein
LFFIFGVSMLKVIYTDAGLFLEYCPEPLDLLLSDRVCMYAHAQRPVSVQPMNASIPLPAHLISYQGLERFQEIEVAWCDRDWLEVTLSGLWITEDPDQESGIFMTELDPRLEQRLIRVWQISQSSVTHRALAH